MIDKKDMAEIIKESLTYSEFNYGKLSNSELHFCIAVLEAVIGADTHNTAVHIRRLMLKEKDSRIVRDTEQRNVVYKLEEPSDLIAKLGHYH